MSSFLKKNLCIEIELWFIFEGSADWGTDSIMASLNFPKNDPGLKIFTVLYNEKICPVNK